MEPVGKRTFLRMLYSGVRPSEAARRIAAERGDMSPTTVDREEEEEAAAGEKEVLRLFAYLADRRRAGRQQPADAGAEHVDPPGGAAKGSGLGESPEPYEEEGADERVEELSVRASPEEDEKLNLVLGELVKIMNMLDKGYRARDANESHNQLTAQPVFVKSDQRFRGRDTLYSASVASDRGGKERMVNVSKRCGIIARGFQPRTDPTMFNDVCLCWMF